MIYSVTNDANSIGLTMEMTSRLNSSDEAWSNDPFSVKSTTGGILFTGTSIQTVNTILIILITLLLPAIHKFVRASLLSRGYITTSILSESNTDDAVRILRKTNCNRNSKIFSLTMIVTLAITALLSSSVPYSTKTMIDVKLADDIFLALNRPNHTTFLKEGNQDFVEAKILPGEIELSQLDPYYRFSINTTMGNVVLNPPGYVYTHEGSDYNSINYTKSLGNNNVTYYSSRIYVDYENKVIPRVHSDGWIRPKAGTVQWGSSYICEGIYGEDTQYLYDPLTDTYTGYSHCFDQFQNNISNLVSTRCKTFREKHEVGNLLLFTKKCHGNDYELLDEDEEEDGSSYSINIAFSEVIKVTELASTNSGFQCLTTEIHLEVRGGREMEVEVPFSNSSNSIDENGWSMLETLENASDSLVRVIWRGSSDKARLEHFIGSDPDNIIGLHSAIRNIEKNGAQDGVYLCYSG
ncbi:hypothetical protein HDU92_000090, partial [Lobulomyces angularis]